ncbi:MAG: TonB-dependent receptor [Xanthomonadaceae bacterium]|nr:TonB-dependent receptor [Xanthomonadaceae bacterium]
MRFGSPQRRHPAVTVMAVLWLEATLAGTALADPPVRQLQEITVVGMAPLPGFDVPLLQIPLNVQSAQADDVRQIHGQSLTDLLQRNFQGVNLTQSQGNPWQGNLYFHGFTLSPLLGSPSGISVYMDGVRQNESFAETMNWESIPDFAVRHVELVPGSNPLYGLNTLAAALLLSSKSGFTDPGGSINVSGGSWGRLQYDADFGAHGRTLGLYVGAGNDYESGWRDYSSSRVQQAFVRGDWQPDQDTHVSLSYTGAHGKLFGTQTLPAAWAAAPQAGYTWPDHFTDNTNQFNLQASRQLGADWTMQADAYLRISQSRSFNSNTNAYLSVAHDGAPGYSASGRYDPGSVGLYYYAGLTPAYDPANPAATINNVPASNVLGNVHTRAYGGSVQAVNSSAVLGRDNQFTAGISLDAGASAFSQYAQPAYFPDNPARRGDAVGLLPFGPQPLTYAGTGNRTVGVYFMDVFALTSGVHASAGARYNASQLAVSDRSGIAPGINGRQTFRRLNPSLGATWAIDPQLGAYLNYDEGMRTPTPIEFECADPAAPCSLPNDFIGDPPLKPVVVRTLAGGLRGNLDGGRLRWNVTPYYSRVSNDILTIYTGGSSQGYFANVPRTLRKGVDVGLGGQSGRFEWQANYSYVSATYGTAFALQSADNASADANGVIQVRRGDRMPGVPRNLVNLGGEYHLTGQWSVGANVQAYSSQYAVGDENNRDARGAIPGYAVVGLDLHWQTTRRLSFFMRVDNLFGRHYFVNGQLGNNVFDTPQRLIDLTGPGSPALFAAPGAPRALLLGFGYDFGESAGRG